MPYWNRPKELARSLDAYSRLYPDLDMEVSICDDGSMEPLKGVLSTGAIKEPPRWKVTTLPRKYHALNPCVPINAAVRAATSDIIVLTNPEIEHREPVFYKMLAALNATNDYVMTGCRNVGNEAWYAGPETRKAPLDGREPIPPGSHLHFCVMFHRALFERVGGFDEAYRNVQGCDDNDWLWKLYAVGANFKYVPGVVWHHPTKHKWTGTPQQAAALLRRKWGHLPEFKNAS